MSDTVYAPTISERTEIIENRLAEFMTRYERVKGGMPADQRKAALEHIANAQAAMDRGSRRRLMRHMIEDISEADGALGAALAALPDR